MSGYGTPNTDYVRSWRDGPDHGPMWALNLMRYRPKAQYADGRATDLTGWQADDLYAPHAELAQVGAESVIRAAVTHQLVGDGARWDRIAVARYPIRGAMTAMQRLPAFQERHQHKQAGMEFTIVMATFRQPGALPPTPEVDRAEALLLQVMGDAHAPDYAADLEATPISVFDVENVIIGDERRYAQARWHALPGHVAEDLRRRPRAEDAGSYVLLLAPERTRLGRALAE